MNVDIQGLIDDGHLKLADVFKDADWHELRTIASYRTHDYPEDSRPFVVIPLIQQYAVKYDIMAYRWVADHDGEAIDKSDIMLDDDELKTHARQVAKDRDEP